jgi:type I restriction enzyme, S subunit
MSSKALEVKQDERGAPAGLIPKLRFQEFQNFGMWKRKKLKEVASLYKGKGISKSEIAVDGELPCIRYGELYTCYGEVIAEVFSKTNTPSSELFLSEVNDVIIPSSGETKADIAKASCVLAGGVALGGDLNVIRSSENGIFLSYYMNSALRREISRVAQGDAVVHLYSSQLEELELAIPSLREQEKIAAILTTVDEQIAAETRKLNALKAHNREMMRQLFPAEGETVPRIRFREFQDARVWLSAPIGEIFETSSGGTPDRSKKEYWRGDIPWISTALVNFNRIEKAHEFLTDEGLMNSSAKMFPVGTILLAMYGQGKTRGKVAILNIPATTNQACAAILPKEGIDAEFVFLTLSNRYQELRALSNSGGQENLSQTLIRSFSVSIPWDIEEQMKIKSCLSHLNELIAEQAHRIEALTQHKAGLMQQLFPVIDEVQA